MNKFNLVLVIIFFATACAQKPKQIETSETIAPPPDVKIENLNLRSANASIKSISGKKIHGLLQFAQSGANVKAEIHLEGLKPGPYELHIASKINCKNPDLKNRYRDLGQVIADKNGVVKSTIEIKNISTHEMTKKTMVILARLKKIPKAVACGVIENL